MSPAAWVSCQQRGGRAPGQGICCGLQVLPLEATEPEGRDIMISPKGIPVVSSNHVESRNGQGAVPFEIPGGVSMDQCITKLLYVPLLIQQRSCMSCVTAP